MEKKKKDNKFLLVIIVILAVAVVGLIGFIVYDKSIIVNQADSEEKRADKKENKNTDTTNNQKESSNLITFNKDNCLNNEDIKQLNQVSIWKSFNILGLTLTTNESRKSVKVSVRWDILNTNGYFNNPATNGQTNQDYQITFDKNVEDIYGASLGFDAYSFVYLFLLDDGSVSYITFNDILENQNFEVKKIENVDNIVKFVNISYGTASDEVGRPPTTIAYKNDGTFYDLSKLINIY